MNSETVFNGKVVPMNKDQTTILATALLAEKSGAVFDPKGKEEPQWLLSKIIEKRIEVLKLPIKFTDLALVAHIAFSDRPAKSVIVLIDALTKYEGQTVTAEMLCELYPFGFYDDATLMDYIDNYLKPRKVKWAEIY